MQPENNSEKKGKFDPYSEEELKRIKKNIMNTYDYNRDDFDRYRKYTKFTYDTSLTSEDKTLASALGRPQLESNQGEAYISRQMGEFAKQEPAFSVSSADNRKPVDIKLIEFLEGYLRHVQQTANEDNSFAYRAQHSSLGGGFGAIKVTPKYRDEMAFEVDFEINTPYDVLLCGWDPLAVLPHKGDGRFYYEGVPFAEEDAKERFGIELDSKDFNNGFGDFSWQYKTSKEKIVLIFYYYEKKRKRTKIHYLTNRQTVTDQDYKASLVEWEKNNHLEQPAQIVKSRWTMLTTIYRTTLYSGGILDYEETDYAMFGMAKISGNSQFLHSPDSNTVYEMSRPYLYHTYDIQRAKNYALQSWVNWIENINMAKWVVAKEAIPDEDQYRAAYINIQQPGVTVYNGFMPWDPTSSQGGPTAIPPPQPMRIQSMPQEIGMLFDACDKTYQTILGSYDASLGINDNQLSGKAIFNGSINSNATAQPYLNSYIQAWQHIANCLIDLIPKYLKTERSVPIISKSGKREYVDINGKDGLKIEYTPSSLNVRVTASANYTLQKDYALQTMTGLGKAFPAVSQFMNSKGLPWIFENLDIKGADILRQEAQEWVVEQQQKAAQSQQQNPLVMKEKNEAARIQLDTQESQAKTADAQARLQLDKQEQALKAAQQQQESVFKDRELTLKQQEQAKDMMEISLDAKQAHDEIVVKMAHIAAEKAATAAELMLDAHDQDHRHKHDKAKFEHEIIKHQVEVAAAPLVEDADHDGE